MKQQHHPTDMKTFEKGINSDANKELLGTRQGEHVDARNMRSISMDGDNFAKKKVKGEELLYPNIDNRCTVGTNQPLSTDYDCMMTQEINGHIVEIWASPNAGEYSLIRVDGKIVCMSEDFPVDIDFPLEYDKNESCIGGEFYITDDNSRPMVFSLMDLMLNSGMTVAGQTGVCSQKYFDDFNIDEYVIGVTSEMFKVAFIKQESSPSGSYDEVFGSLGLAVGYHSYSYRYVSADGDRTGWSPISELIPVIQSVSSGIEEFPNVGNYSKDPNIASPSVYGNHIRLKYYNTNGFSFIEVRRDSWITGSQLGSQPVSEIIGSIDIQDGLNVLNILDYAAPDETQEPIDVSEITEAPLSVRTAKSIRYYNSKLWLGNVKYNSQDIDDTITVIDPNDPVFSTIEKIGKKGHTDVYNSTYYKSNMRGEAQGVGVVVFDDSGARTYATEIIQTFELPNRRDEASADTLGTSYKGLPRAATTDGLAGAYVHEVFDHANAIGKNDGNIFVNPLQKDILALTKYSGAGSNDTGDYATFTPVSQTDTDSTHGNRVNTYVSTKSNITGRTLYDYNPKGFGLDYYSQGIAFKGIDPTTLPDWADGFSVVQTNPAGRVVAQGLAYYDIIPTDGGFAAGAGKQKYSVIVNFPDLDGDIGLTPQILDDLITNTGTSSPYRIQAVSPLGYFTEVNSFLREYLGLRNRGTDMITYCRVLHDQGLINPSWVGGVGNTGYTGFGVWRETSSNNSSFPSNTNPNLFVIDDAEIVPTKTGTGTNVRLTFTQPIYSQEFTSGAGDNQDFNHNGLKKWQEPIYVVNLVKDEAAINTGISSEYNYTGHYVKLRSPILVSDGTATQSAILVSERWEDCIQTIGGQVFNAYSALERFVWVVDENGASQRWLNVTNKTAAQIATITSDISTNGFHSITDASGTYDVYGIYTSQEVAEGSATIFVLTLSDVPQNSVVEVRYDNRIPVRVFGGDTFVNEHIWAVHDTRYNENGDPQDASHDFRFNIPFPYPCYGIADDNRIIRDTTNLLVSRYQEDDLLGLNEFRFDVGLLGVGLGVNPASIRQLITMWTAETRVNLSFAFNYEASKTAYGSQFYPLKNYIPRPYKWKSGAEDVLPPDSNNFLEENKMFEDYYTDYGQEWLNWGLGGFRFKPQVNTDYSQKQTTEIITTVPSVGFDEQTEFCTRVLWSVTRPINIQNSPTVKTFLPDNFYDISDDTGEIKFLWDADSGKGNNMYAITNNGVCILLIDKRIINEVNGDELATAGSDIGGVVSELWIDKQKGMDDETWRTWAEYANALFWSNNTSSYMLSGNEIKDLAETGYTDLYIREFLEKTGNGFDSKMAGVYDVLHKEYYATVDNKGQSGDNHTTLIFGVTQDMLQCQSDYRYDKYLSINNDVYGMKNMETYKLGVGNLINGEEYECYVSGVSDADIYSDKEFIRIRVNSNSKPKRIEFFDNYEEYKANNPSSIVDALANPINIKDYFGYECYIPRKDLAPRNRQQGREMIFKIVSDDDENFFVSTVGVQYKTLK